MAAAGLTVRCDISQLGTVGFLDAVRAMPRHLRLLRQLVTDARAGRYAMAVLIDYPGFHLRLGHGCAPPVSRCFNTSPRSCGPGGAERIHRFRHAADRLAVILPFEEDWFASRGIPCSFVGHPLMDQILAQPSLPRERALACHPTTPFWLSFPAVEKPKSR